MHGLMLTVTLAKRPNRHIPWPDGIYVNDPLSFELTGRFSGKME